MSYLLELQTAHKARRQRLVNFAKPVVKLFKKPYTIDPDIIELNKIIIVVCKFTGYSRLIITGKGYGSNVIEAQRLICYIAYGIYGIKAKKIAKKINKHYSNVYRGYEDIKKRIKDDSDLAYDVTRIRMQIG